MSMNHDAKPKDDELERMKAEFLAKGGKITKVDVENKLGKGSFDPNRVITTKKISSLRKKISSRSLIKTCQTWREKTMICY